MHNYAKMLLKNKDLCSGDLWMHTVYVPVYYTHAINTRLQIYVCCASFFPRCQACWHRIALSCDVASQPVTCAYDSHLLLPCLRMTHALQRRRLLSSLFLRWLLCLSPTSSWDGCRKANGWGSSSPILMSDRPSGLYQYRQLLMYVNEHYRIFFASLLHNVLVFSSDCLTNTAASSSLLRKPSNPENDMLQAILVSTHTSHKLTQFAGSLRWFTFNRRFT